MRQMMFVALVGAGFMIFLVVGSRLAPWPVEQAARLAPWPVEQAARISYDPKAGSFILTNLSPHTIWYDGRPEEGPSPVFERQLPTGQWVRSYGDGCGTYRGWQPLRSGQSVIWYRWRREWEVPENTCSPEVRELVKQDGVLDKLAVRGGLRVTCDPKTSRWGGRSCSATR